VNVDGNDAIGAVGEFVERHGVGVPRRRNAPSMTTGRNKRVSRSMPPAPDEAGPT